MPVIVEATSVIIRNTSIEKLYDSVDSFLAHMPNQTACTDGKLTRISFMALDDVQIFTKWLEKIGFVHGDGENRADFITVDQMDSYIEWCDWCEIIHIEKDDYKFSFCREIGDMDSDYVTPEGWFPDKISRGYDDETLLDHFEYIGKDDKRDIYINKKDGRRYYVRRTGNLF